MNRTYILFASFLCGLGSTLFVATPFGRVAMFDLACYFIAPVLYVLNYKKFTSAERRLLLLAALWLIGAIWSNRWRQEPFETFKKRYILSTHEVFKSYAQLCDSDEIYADAYICGSDQVWNENFVMHDDNGRPWFLDFGSADTKRIAYAPSFGASALSQSYIKYITPMLKQFDAISVREVTGVELCRKAGRYDAVHVLDPTLLLDKKSYQEAFVNEELRTSIEGAYAFLYFLKNGNEDGDNPFGAVVETCHKMGLKIVVATVYEDIES